MMKVMMIIADRVFKIIKNTWQLKMEFRSYILRGLIIITTDVLILTITIFTTIIIIIIMNMVSIPGK